MSLSCYLEKLATIGKQRRIPNISLENAIFLQQLIKKHQPKHFLEIGTANGYSTLQFASVLLPPATITTIEQDWRAHTEAIAHFHKCHVNNIFSYWGDAKGILPMLADAYFDMVFIDAMKREYLAYLQLCIPKLTQNALVVIDDVEKFSHKMSNLYDWLQEKNIPYTLEKTDPDDSIMLIRAETLIGATNIE